MYTTLHLPIYVRTILNKLIRVSFILANSNRKYEQTKNCNIFAKYKMQKRKELNVRKNDHYICVDNKSNNYKKKGTSEVHTLHTHI